MVGDMTLGVCGLMNLLLSLPIIPERLLMMMMITDNTVKKMLGA